MASQSISGCLTISTWFGKRACGGSAKSASQGVLISEGEANGSSVLDGGPRDRVLLFWGSVLLAGCKAALTWSLIVYGSLFLFSKAHSADFYTGLFLDTTYSGTECNADRIAAGASGSCTVNNNTAGTNCQINGYPDATHWRRYLSGGNSYYYCSLPNGTSSCPTGMGEHTELGLCEPDPEDACELAVDDSYSSSATTETNPGLCVPGDFAELDYEQCAYSASAGALCVANVSERVDLSSTLPVVLDYTIEVDFTNVSCELATDPPDVFEATECEEPPEDDPITCPVGYVPEDVTGLGTWTCVSDPSAPPAPPTNTLPTTTTTTTTTTTNPDGSVTTVEESQTEYGECPEGQVCDAQNVGPLELEEVKTFRQATTAFVDAVADSPIGNLGSGLAASVPSSTSCPTWSTGTIPLVDDSYTIDAHCDFVSGHESTIRTIMAIGYTIAGILIILGA